MKWSDIINEGNLVAMKRRRKAYIGDADNFDLDEYEVETRFDELYAQFSQAADPMPVFRGMTVTRPWLAALKRGQTPSLGVHWAYDAAGARVDLPGHDHADYQDPAARAKMVAIVIAATVRKNAVDWESTFYQNIVYPDEAEVRIADAPVLVDHIVVGAATIKLQRAFPTGNQT